MAVPTKAGTTVQSSVSNSAGGTTTSTARDRTAKFGALVTGIVTNGATGPTVPCDFVVQISIDGTNWEEFNRQSTSAANNAVSVRHCIVPDYVRYYRTVFTGNTGQAVTVEAKAHEIESIG